MTATSVWTPACQLPQLLPGRGVAVLLPDGTQVAVFSLETVHAVSNVDPFSGAAVLSRGIAGELGGAPVVASPMHKQHFDLRTGVCVEDDTVRIAVYPVRIADGQVLVGSA